MVNGSGGGGDEDLVFRVARRLAAARTARGLSQERLAAMLGIAVKNLQRMESGKQNLSLATIERLCSVLGVRPEAVLGGTSSAVPAAVPSPLDRLSAAGFSVRASTAKGRRPAGAVPVTTLRAAAGRLADPAHAIEAIGWVVVSRTPSEGQFVAEVRGSSMEPRIVNGALCLFGPPSGRPFGDRVFLVAHEAIADDELGGPYTLKRIKSVKRLRGGAGQRVVLESINPTFAPITIDTAGDELRVVAELVRVLVG